MYGLGSALFDLQARVGYGVMDEGGLGPVDSATVNGLIYGGLAAFKWARWGRAVIELDGSQAVVTRDTEISLAPGVQFFPNGDQLLLLGFGALLQFQGGSLFDAGAVAQVGLNFL